jgi:TolB-like protein
MKKNLTFIFCVVIGLRLCAQNSPAPVRLAIVSESSDTVAAADLLTAEFSKNDRVQLLERTEIEKVIREQQLSLNNLDCLKLGHLLGADGLLALQSVADGTNLFLNVQLVAVRPGVLLADERFGRPAQDASAWSANIVSRLEPLLPKLGVLPEDAIPLSVVNFHAGVRTAEAAELERQIFFLTVERLVREKRLFVLERKRMQALSEEKELSSAEAEPFWNGKYLLDGTIDRNGFNPEEVTISARLIPPGGNPVLIEVSGSRTNCVEVVNQLAGKVLMALKLDASPAAWNTVDEADKFFKEAQWNLAWKIFPKARQSAEAAWALGKHDADCMNLRVRTFMPPPDSGVIYFPPREKPSPEKIDDAIQAARLFQEFSRNLPSDQPKPDSEWYKLGLENLTIATRVLQQFNWSTEFYEPVADKLAELRAQARALAELLSRAPSVHDSYFVGSRKVKYDDLYHFQEQPSIYGLKVEGGCLWQEKPEDALALYRELMASPVFRYLHERFWFRDADHSSTRLPSPPRLVAWNNADQKRLPDLWQQFVTELKESPDVSLQMEARALRLADVRFSDMNRPFESRAASEAAYRAANQTYDKELSYAFTNFLDAFVANRIYFKTNNVDVLYLNWGVDDLVERMGGDTSITLDTKESLQNQYRTEYAAKLAAKDKELAQTVAALENLDAFAKQIKILQDNQPYDPQAFVQMFIFGFKDYSHEQAQEIKPLLAEYKKQLSGTWARIGQMQVGQVEANVEQILNPAAVAPPSPNRVAMTNGNPAQPPGGNFPPGRPPWFGQPGTPPQFTQHRFPPDRAAEGAPETPAPEPVVSSNIVTVKDFYPLPTDGLPGDKLDGFRVTDHQLVEGKLLLDFRYNAWVYSFDKNGDWQSSASKVFVGVALFDPASKRWTVAALPESFEEPVGFTSEQSVLWHGELYSSHTGKIRKYDFQKQTWESAGFAMDGGWQFHNLSGRLFITDYNSIQEVTENGRATKLLASIQRQPPVTSLDSQGALMNLVLFTDAQNFVCAAVHNKVFRWDGADWREIGTALASFQPSVFEGGVLFLTDGWNMRPARISCLDTGSTNVELCLGQPDRQRINAPSPNSNDGAKPLWKLPAELSLPNLSAALWQSDLFLMADHSDKQDIVAEERGTRPDGTLEVSHVITGSKFASKDGYNVSLFCFSRDLPAAHKVRLKFEANDGCPPMAGIEFRPGFTMPGTVDNRAWIQFTTNLLLFGQYVAPADFKPGIWVASLDLITVELSALKKMQSDTVLQQKFKADQLAKEVQAKDQQARQAFLQKYDRNHNGVIDDDEREAAQDDPYYIKYRLEQIRAQKHHDN